MSHRIPAVVLPALAVAGLAAWWVTAGPDNARAADPAPAPAAIPVTTAKAQHQDVPVFLDGLGTVQALNVVSIKAQVSGTLLSLPAHEGQEVHKGDIIAQIDPRPYQAALDQANAQKQEDQATLSASQLDLKRYRSLAKSDFAPVQQVDDQTATVNKTTAAIAADTAAVETAQINLDYCTIRAPFDGRVGLYQVDVGNLIQVASQTGILTITQDKPIAAVFTLPEDELVQVQDAMSRETKTGGAVQVSVFDSTNSNKLAQGTLLTPNNTIDTATGTITLRAIFDNKDDHLWPGQFINARVLVNTVKNAVTIPELAVEHGPNGLFVYTVAPNQTVDVTNVKIGYQDNGFSVVTAGLSGGETVVVSGQSRLSPGVHVKPTAASGAQSSNPSDTPG